MKTLIIHPLDPSTSFLKKDYDNLDCTISNLKLSKSNLKKEISSHDKIVILGHGDCRGLFNNGNYIIDPTLVYLLREKDLVGIWCYANEFFKKYGLSGFNCGMFISEMKEARDHKIECFQEDIDQSNRIFAICLHFIIKYKFSLLDQYSSLLTNNVIQFNYDKLFITHRGINFESIHPKI